LAAELVERAKKKISEEAKEQHQQQVNLYKEFAERQSGE